LKISPSVYEELMRAKRAGYSFVDNIFQNTEIILLSEMEFNSFRNLLENEKNSPHNMRRPALDRNRHSTKKNMPTENYIHLEK